ncbi:MAG: 30S ribosome-binding factor RbfA [Bacteroidales bacterium]|nr:30S ribosome-binding factor RbfA [Bacteroidales bacterium]
MESIRQKRVARLVQQELANIFMKKGKNWFGNAMVTLTVVRMTADLSIAKIYVSIYNTTDKNSVLEDIKIYTSEIRKELGLRLAKHLRIIPELRFYIDDSLDFIERIDEALKKK